MKTHLSCHELPKSLWKRYSSNNENHNSWIHKTAVIKNNKQYSSLIIIEYNGKKERWLSLLGLIKEGKHVHNFFVDSPGTKIAYSTLQVATILVAMVPKILKLATWFVKNSP